MYLAQELKNLTDKKQLFTETGDYKQLHSNIGKTTGITELIKAKIFGYFKLRNLCKLLITKMFNTKAMLLDASLVC